MGFQKAMIRFCCFSIMDIIVTFVTTARFFMDKAIYLQATMITAICVVAYFAHKVSKGVESAMWTIMALEGAWIVMLIVMLCYPSLGAVNYDSFSTLAWWMTLEILMRAFRIFGAYNYLRKVKRLCAWERKLANQYFLRGCCSCLDRQTEQQQQEPP